MKIFDANDYFKNITEKNKLLKDNQFIFTRMSSLNMAEEVLAKINRHNSILALSDINSGVIEQQGGGTYFRRRVFTVYLFRKCRLNNMNDYSENLELCRSIFHQIFSKMLEDSEILRGDLIYMNTDRISFKEIDTYLLNGHSGIYFMFAVDEPTNLCYDGNSWYI